MGSKREFLALVTEDDPLSRSHLQDLINDHFPAIRITSFATTVEQTRRLLASHKIDLLFLDIELPDGRGFDVLADYAELSFEVIITTSHNTYALEAIQHSALDYLVKPVKLEDLSKSVERFLHKHEDGAASRSVFSDSLPALQRLPLPTAEGIVFLDPVDIVHLDADGSYSSITLENKKTILVSKPLGDFEQRLFPRGFFRIHNSHIVNLSRITKYIRGEGGYVVMCNDAVIPVSRSKKEEFLRLIGM